jgi:hypothetical protein
LFLKVDLIVIIANLLTTTIKAYRLMKQTPNWKSKITLLNRCGSCKWYEQFIKKDILTARGRCKLKSVYKQRTERCSKYEQ